MSVYNGEKYLREAIDSILNQTFSDFEFLIIDDASTDMTPKILQSYDDPRIKIVRNIENLGLTKSLNIGLKEAKGDYIARMDADDISLPERFEKQVAFLDSHPDVALVGTSAMIIDSNGTIKGTSISLSNPQHRDFVKGNRITHGSVMIRREIMESSGGYDEFFRRCQDFALWLKISKVRTIYNLPDILYQLRIHKDSVSNTGKESICYHILAIRIAESSISSDILEEIERFGIKCLREYMTKDEWIFYHYSMAGRYRTYGDLKSVRKEYLKIFRLEPWNILNIVNLVRIMLGNRVLDTTGHLYHSLKERIFMFSVFRQ